MRNESAAAAMNSLRYRRTEFGIEPLANDAKTCNLRVVVSELTRMQSVFTSDFTCSHQATFGIRG